MKNKMINKLYSYLENKTDIDFLPMDIYPKLERITDEEHFIFSVESNVQLQLEKGHIRKMFGNKQDKTEKYILNRIENTSNPLLKARYNQFLWTLNSNNQFCEKAIDEYQTMLKLFLLIINEEKSIHNFNGIFEIIVELSIKIKYELPELQQQTITYLISNSTPNRLKTYILTLISKVKLMKNKDIEFTPQLCIDLANSETDYNWIKINLDLAFIYVQKHSKLNNLKLHIFELLGDNEKSRIKEYDGKPESLVIPHQNQEVYTTMMEYYKLSKNQMKLDETTKIHNSNKRNLKYLKLSAKVERSKEEVTLINSLFNSIVNGTSQMIILDLCLGLRFPFIPNKDIELAAKESIEKYYYLKMMKTAVVDENKNSREMDTFTHQKFQFYGIAMEVNIMFIIDLILSSIESKKLSNSKLTNFLNKHTFFGQELKFSRADEVDISYTPFEQIDFALKSFFQQCNNLKLGKRQDWRIPIDIFSLKFEGILRDIIGLACGVITKVDNKGNTSDMLLDDLLRCDCFSTIFDEEDRNLFLFTFTNKGFNIRNNVAHSFYKPQDYTIYKAVLVLISILRLAKFNPKI